MEILTTGVSSGLGRYVYESLGGIGFTRNSSIHERDRIKKTGADIIIHCAVNSRRGIYSDSLNQYLEDNVFLTRELVSIPHKKFIFISSMDVYPKDNLPHSEDEIIEAESVSGLYGITKLMSESIVRSYSKDHLILRGSAFLGKYSRKNSLIKMIEDEECVLTLSGDSIFNYVLHSDISDFIRFSIDSGIKGIYNLTSSENITLFDVGDILGKKVTFGNYKYNVGNVNNSKISSVFPAFRKTSKEIITEFTGGKT